MKRKIIAATLTLSMLCNLFPMSIFAQSPEESTSPEFTVICQSDSLSEDELFNGYVESVLYNNTLSTYGNYGESHLSENDKRLYNSWKTYIHEVAQGNHETVEFSFNLNETGQDIFFSYEELGLTDSCSNNEIVGALFNTMFPTTIQGVLSILLADCPYDLYWFDKEMGFSFGVSELFLTSDESGNSYVGVSATSTLTIKMRVSATYSASGLRGTNQMNTSIPQKVHTAKETAQAIVDTYREKSDLEKLEAYRNEICDLVSYNDDAALGLLPYGDPWQLIWVFDGDTSTNVVCEGYSKAFQYLCDLSEFNTDVTCYTVTGSMSNGPHMWNIVTLTQKNYIVDVTNCDTGTIGYPDKLFLAGANGTAETNYSITLNGKDIVYVYDDSTKAMYGTSILSIHPEKYTESFTSVTIKATQQELVCGYTQPPTLTAATNLSGNKKDDVVYQWYQKIGDNLIELPHEVSAIYTLPIGLSAGQYQYICKATYAGITLMSEPILISVNRQAGNLEQAADSSYKTQYVYTGSSIPVPTSKDFTTNSSAEITFEWYSGWNNGNTLSLTKLDSSPINAGQYTLLASIPQSDTVSSAQTAICITIAPADLTTSNTTITLGKSLVYNGLPQTQTIESVQLNGIPVTYEVLDNCKTNAGTYQLIVKGTNNFTGQQSVEFTIQPTTFQYFISNQTTQIGQSVSTLQANKTATGVNNEQVQGALRWFKDANYQNLWQESDVFSGNVGDRITLYWMFTPNKSETNYQQTPTKGSIVVTLTETIDEITSDVYPIDENRQICNIQPGATLESIQKDLIGQNIKVFDSKGNPVKSTAPLGTGYVLTLGEFDDETSLTVVVSGDINGDAVVNTVDFLMMKQAILNIRSLKGAYQKAATFASHSNNVPTSRDLILLKQFLLNIITEL